MQLRKDDMDEMIKHIEKQLKKGFGTVMYLEGNINKPNNLIFLKNEQEREIFDRMNTDSHKYSSANINPLLDVLKTAQKTEKKSPELGFLEKFPKKIDLMEELKERQPKQERTVSQRLRSDLEAAEVEHREKVKTRTKRH